MTSSMSLCYLLLVTSLQMHMVTSSGYMLRPMSRPSGWRLGEGGSFPIDRNDENLNCGGADNQWKVNEGKCGVCGDPYQGPREHEAGGKYATGKTTVTLTAGTILPVTIVLTGNKLGWFEFRICPHDNVHVPVPQDCLDRHILKVAHSNSTKIKVPSNKVYFNDIGLQLPYDMSCEQCFLQWKYQTGDVKDDCSDCWGKEQLYSCADISILAASSTKPLPTTTAATITTTTHSTLPSTPTTVPMTSPPPIPSTTIPATSPLTTPSSSQNCRANDDWKDRPGMNEWCRINCALGHCPAIFCVCEGHTLPPDWEVCGANSDWANDTAMEKWCRINCHQGHCPADKCTCPSWSTTQQSYTEPHPHTVMPSSHLVRICQPRRPLDRIPGMTRWCHKHCHSPAVCPSRVCLCKEEGISSPTKSGTSQPTTMSISMKGSPTINKTTPSLHKTTPLVANTTPPAFRTIPQMTKTTPPVAKSPPRRGSCGQACCAVGAWSRIAGMHNWCQNNCVRGHCPPTHCRCSH